jgi:hypothetical protein
MWNLATLVLFYSCVSLALGWLATSHVVYRVVDGSPFAFMAPALVAMDRMLLGQIAVLGSFVRKLIYARELLVGLGGLRTEGESEAPAATPVPGAAASFAWVRRGLGMLDTARRVQARMAGHVAREIAGDAIREQTTPTPTQIRRPLRPNASASLGALPQSSSASLEVPSSTPVPNVRVAAPWETDDEDGETEREARGTAAGGTMVETTGEASGAAAGGTIAETTGEASGAAAGGTMVETNSFAALGVPSTGEASGAAMGATIAETPAGVTGSETTRSVDMLFAEINAC